jgi:hypothetical protein
MTTKEHHPNPTALDVLRAIAPGGVIASDDSAFIDAVVFLRGQGLPPAGVEEIACEVRQLCRAQGSWSVVDGRRCRVLPFFQP